jgi:glycosyltransferase involved in cell wall biosynthesis
LRILHAVLSGGFYGSERYCIDLAIAQVRAGHDVAVLIRDRASDCARQFHRSVAQAESAGAFAGTLRIVNLPRTLPNWLQRPAAGIVLRQFRPDVVHSHLNPAARRVGGPAQRLGIAHVMTLHLDYDPNEHAAIDGLIALSARQRAGIAPGFAGAVTVVWNWLPSRVADALTRVAGPEVAGLRRRWRAEDDAVVFGSVGRLTGAKGMDVLIRAFRSAFADGKAPVRLVLVGDGEARGDLERLAGGDERVVFAGHQEDIAPFYRAFDVFVSAARFEPFGLAIVEAMAAGCRLVVTSTDGPAEFVTDARVLWAAPGRDDELAAQLLAAVAHRRERWRYDLAPFTIERAAAEIEGFYRKVAGASDSVISS